jgi:Methyltransferase FkbM domain
MRTLDSLIMSKEIEAPDVIKIDVEGAETTVFEGARQTLRTNNPASFVKPMKIWGAVAICVGIDFDAISSMTRLPDHAARSMV